MLLRVFISILMLLSTLPINSRAAVLSGSLYQPQIGISIGESSWQVLKQPNSNINAEQTASEILFLSISNPKELWVNLGVVNSINGLGGRAMLVSSVGRKLFDADLRLKRDAKQILEKSLIVEDYDDLDGLQFRFWIEPEEVKIIRQGNRYAVDKVRLKVRCEAEEDNLSPVLERVRRELERRVNTAKEYKDVRDIVAEAGLANILSKNVAKEKLEEIFFNTDAFYNVAGYWSKADVLVDYIRTFGGEGDVVAGGIDISGLENVLRLLNGFVYEDYASAKTIVIERDFPEIAEGFIKRWYSGYDGTHRGFEEETLRGLIESYFLRLWVAIAIRMDKNNWKEEAERLIGITVGAFLDYLNSGGGETSVNQGFTDWFREIANDYVRSIKSAKEKLEKDGSTVIEMDVTDKHTWIGDDNTKKITIKIKGKEVSIDGRRNTRLLYTGHYKGWFDNLVIFPVTDVRDIYGTPVGESYLGIDGNIHIREGESFPKQRFLDAPLLFHYIKGHIIAVYLKKYYPEKWMELIHAFRTQDNVGKFKRDLRELWFGMSYSAEKDKASKGVGDKMEDNPWRTDHDYFIWSMYVNESLALYGEISAIPEDDRSDVQKRFYKKVDKVLKESGYMDLYEELVKENEENPLDASYIGEYRAAVGNVNTSYIKVIKALSRKWAIPSLYKKGPKAVNKAFAYLLAMNADDNKADSQEKALLKRLIEIGAMPDKEITIIPYDEQVKRFWAIAEGLSWSLNGGVEENLEAVNKILNTVVDNPKVLEDAFYYAPKDVMKFLSNLQPLTKRSWLPEFNSNLLALVKKHIKKVLTDETLKTPDALFKRALYLNAVTPYWKDLFTSGEMNSFERYDRELKDAIDLSFDIISGSSAPLIAFKIIYGLVFVVVPVLLYTVLGYEVFALDILFGGISWSTWYAFYSKSKFPSFSRFELLATPFYKSEEYYKLLYNIYESTFYSSFRFIDFSRVFDAVLKQTIKEWKYEGNHPDLLFPGFIYNYEEIKDKELVNGIRYIMNQFGYNPARNDMDYKLLKALYRSKELFDANGNEYLPRDIEKELKGLKKRLSSIAMDSDEYKFISHLLSIWQNRDKINIPSDKKMHNIWANEVLSELEGSGANIGDLEWEKDDELKEVFLDIYTITSPLILLRRDYEKDLGILIDYILAKIRKRYSDGKLSIYSFSSPKYKKGKILIAKARKGEIFKLYDLKPIPTFHESIEWLGEEDLITAEIKDNRVIIKDNEGNTLTDVEFDPEEMNDKWIEKAKKGNVHYALRILQRTIFGENDVQFSGYIRLLKLVLGLEAEGIEKKDIIAVFDKMGASITSDVGFAGGEVDTKSEDFRVLWKRIIEQVNEDDELKAYLQYLSGGELYLGELANSPHELSGMLEESIEGAQEGDGEAVDKGAISAALVQSGKREGSLPESNKAGGILLFAL